MAIRNTNIIIPLEASVIDATALTGTYEELHEGVDYPVYLFRITNSSDKDVEISFDKGTTDHDFLPAGKTIELGTSPGENIRWPIGTSVWVKGAAAASGYIYLSAYTISKDI